LSRHIGREKPDSALIRNGLIIKKLWTNINEKATYCLKNMRTKKGKNHQWTLTEKEQRTTDGHG
jgi:hypothetical protein